MHALVTGVAGFVGSSIAERLLSDGWVVRGVDNFSPYYAEQLKLANVGRLVSPNFELRREDLLQTDLHALLDGIDVVFHQAGQPGVRSSWGSEFATYVENNVRLTQALLEVAKGSPRLQRFVYASSSSVYGDAERYPTTELDRPAPVSPYGVTKLAGEHLCSLYARNFAVPTVSLRYFTVYGPRQRPDMAFTRFARAAASGTQVTIFGSGEQVRDFTFVADIVDANLRAASVDVAPGSIFNISGGSNVSVNVVLELLEEIAGRAISVRRGRTVDGDVFRTGGSAERAYSALGWQPTTVLKEGLRLQYEWSTLAFLDGHPAG